TEGIFYTNLPFNAAPIPPADLPSANAATATFNGKTSLVSYDNVGNEVILDVYSAKVSPNTWEVTVFDKASQAAGGGFPYTGGPLATVTLTFDPTTGRLDALSPSSITFNVPNGAALTLDLSQTTQVAADYTVISARVNGNAPSEVE